MSVIIRELNSGGFQQVKSEAKTVGGLKQCVVGKLQPSWEDFNFTLDTKHIRVYRQGGGGVHLSNDEEFLDTTITYYALEYFTTVPFLLYRTVRNDEVSPCTQTHPDYLTEGDRRWTSLSPLHCAAMKPNELQLPWCEEVIKGADLKLHIRGVSLFCVDLATDEPATTAPFTSPIQPEEFKKHHSQLSLEDYYNSIEKEGVDLDPTFGILRTEMSHVVDDDGVKMTRESVNESAKGSGKKNPRAQRREVYFRYKLRPDVNLGKYGMAVVYDNYSQGHCTLIREKDPASATAWIPVLEARNYVPMRRVYEYYSIIEEGGSNERINEFFRSILDPSDGDNVEPEYFTHNIHGGRQYYRIFPKVASLFVLHDLTMKVFAEPEKLSQFDNDAQWSMYVAALILYHLGDDDDDLRMAIEELEVARYQVESTNNLSLCETLLDAIEGVFYEEEEISSLDLGLDKEEADEAIVAAAKILRSVLQEAYSDCDRQTIK